MSEIKINRELSFSDETYAIRGAVFDVYKEMGSGFLEAVYQECLSKEFKLRDIPFVAQAQLQICYKGEQLVQTYVPDFICYNSIIVEIKGVQNITPQHKAQLLNYLKATQLKLGLLVNFGAHPKVQIERLIK